MINDKCKNAKTLICRVLAFLFGDSVGIIKYENG